ncbi:MAG: serine/threonine-protein kinase [Vicinamibacterales bacterium]
MNELDRIGRYHTVRLLGRGGMGEVYLARDPLIDRHVAVKLLAASFDHAARERFTREARAAGRLHHEHIVTIFDVGEHGGRPFIAMEYVPGATLAALIHQPAPPPLAELLGLVDDACAGLAFAHRAGVVHLDVKPENLIRHDDGRLKILDFGIARVVAADETQTRHVLGTLRYMSPEQLNGGEVDHRSDVFGIGCVIYEAVAGRPAFGATWPEVLARVASDAVPRLADVVPGVPDDLDRIAQKAMARNPAARYADLETLRAELAAVRAALDGAAGGRAAPRGTTAIEPPRATGGVAAPPLAAAVARPRWPARRWATGAALAAALVGTGVAWYRSGGTTAIQQAGPTLPTPDGEGAGPPPAAAGAAVEAEVRVEVWRAVARRDYAAALEMLRAQPAAAAALVGELAGAARSAAAEARRDVEGRGRAARETPAYRAGIDALARARRADGSGATLDGLADTWAAVEAFGRVTVAPTVPARTATTATATPAPRREAQAPDPPSPALPSAPMALPDPGATAPALPPPRPLGADPPRRVDASGGVPADERKRTDGTRAVPPPAGEPPAPTRRGPTAEEGARAALAGYEAAYAARDVAALRRVYPGLPDAQRDALARTFTEAVSYDVNVQVTSLSVGDATVTAAAEVTHALVPKVGSPSKVTQSVRFVLAPMGAGWVIQRLDVVR